MSRFAKNMRSLPKKVKRKSALALDWLLQTKIGRAALPKLAAQRKPKQASRLRIALIGGGMHAAKTVKQLVQQPGCEIVYVCDVDPSNAAARARQIKSATQKRPKTAVDFRIALADPKVDAVVIVTPHHWHALATVWALQAGKHVYVEKPINHSFSEGPIILAAAKKYNRIVMPGTQLRSNTSLAQAGAFMQAGHLGEITLVHCIIHKDRPALPPSGPAAVPEGVNYDLWLGPRPDRPMTRSKFHYHWHWFWDFGNGALGNNGIHRIDAARFALNLQGRGDITLSIGGRFGPKDMIETPNTQLCLHRFGKVWVLQDVLGVKPKPYRNMANAVVFHGTQGVIVYNAGKATLCDLDFNPIRVFEGGQDSHYGAFMDAVKNRKVQDSFPALDEAIQSSDLCHFGNISHRAGTVATDAEIVQKLAQLQVPDFVMQRFAAMRENITAAGGGDLTLGEVLQMQEGAMPFVGASGAAAALLHPEERPPYALPSLVSLQA